MPPPMLNSFSYLGIKPSIIVVEDDFETRLTPADNPTDREELLASAFELSPTARTPEYFDKRSVADIILNSIDKMETKQSWYIKASLRFGQTINCEAVDNMIEHWPLPVKQKQSWNYHHFTDKKCWKSKKENKCAIMPSLVGGHVEAFSPQLKVDRNSLLQSV